MIPPIVSNLFTRQILKTYTVLVSPAPSLELYNTTGYITIPVHGKPAKSMYTILERFYVVVDDCTTTTTTGAKTAKYDPMQHTNDNQIPTTRSRTAALLNVTTYTGRQHQVRVHCAYGLGTPIIGDDLYNNNHQHSRMTGQHPMKHAKKDHRRIAKLPSEVVPVPPERFHLHASSLYIPCIQETIYAPLPKWWIPILEYWRSYQPVNNNMTTSESG
jgi:23S rRNA-/tRNA-specific pseudouridylate synthase